MIVSQSCQHIYNQQDAPSLNCCKGNKTFHILQSRKCQNVSRQEVEFSVQKQKLAAYLINPQFRNEDKKVMTVVELFQGCVSATWKVLWKTSQEAGLIIKQAHP